MKTPARRVHEVARRLGLTVSEFDASSRVEVGEDVMVTVDTFVTRLTSVTSLDITVEVSVDGENFTPAARFLRRQLGWARIRVGRTAARFVRLYYRTNGSAGGGAVLGASINLSKN